MRDAKMTVFASSAYLHQKQPSYAPLMSCKTLSQNLCCAELASDELCNTEKTMLIGYARVSTVDQDLSLQQDALIKAGCEKIFEDKASGTLADRPGLELALSHLRKDDVLIVWKLDRVGRSLKHIVEFITKLNARDVQFRSLTESIDTTTAAGRFFFHITAALAQMERDLIAERTNAGLQAARARGRLGGRRPKLNPEQLEHARELIAAGKPVKDVARLLNVDRSTLFRQIKRLA